MKDLFDSVNAEKLGMNVHTYRDMKVVLGIVGFIVLCYIHFLLGAAAAVFLMFNSSMSWFEMRDKIIEGNDED